MNRIMKSKERRQVQTCRDHKALQVCIVIGTDPLPLLGGGVGQGKMALVSPLAVWLMFCFGAATLTARAVREIVEGVWSGKCTVIIEKDMVKRFDWATA